mmetsp:Transcript_23334/g.40595  ORF Transcript_23334/g.40595 Transcript_23334/m.40595 type:complete len:325 (-) Transcript_23334:383-1357(-)
MRHGAGIEPHQVHPVRQIEFFHHQPAPQGPAGEGTIADIKVIGHDPHASPSNAPLTNANLWGGPSRAVIDGHRRPGGRGKACNGKRVDLVAQHLISRQTQHRLHLRQDYTKMGNSNDMSVRMCSLDPADRHRHTRRGLIPAFAARWRVITRRFPIGAAQVGMPLGHGTEMHPVPGAKMELAQGRVVGQPAALPLNRMSGGDSPGQVRGDDKRVIGQMRAQPINGPLITQISRHIAPAGDACLMGRSVTDPVPRRHGMAPLRTRGKPATTWITQVACAASAMLSRPCASRNRRASALSGTMPCPTSFETTTTGAAQAASASSKPA